MEVFFARLKELKGTQSTVAFARSIGIPQPSMDRYLKGRVPTVEVVKLLCSVYHVSADWLLGLDGGSGGQRATASGAGAIAVVGANATVSAGRPGTPPAVPADCSKCRLMQAHLREITGRG